MPEVSHCIYSLSISRTKRGFRDVLLVNVYLIVSLAQIELVCLYVYEYSSTDEIN